MSDIEVEFDNVDAGASKTYPAQASSLRKGGHVMLKSKPCKIVDISTSKTGKHGHAKCHIVGLDIFEGKKYEDISPSTHNMTVPVVTLKTYTLLNVDDGFLELMDDDGNTREDLKAGDDILKQISEKEGESLSVQVLSACGTEKVINVKVLQD